MMDILHTVLSEITVSSKEKIEQTPLHPYKLSRWSMSVHVSIDKIYENTQGYYIKMSKLLAM